MIWDLPVNGTLLCTNYNKNSVIFGSPGKIKRSQIQESDLANVESLALIKTSVQLARESGFSVITGSWNVPGSPTAVIIDIADVKLRKNVLNEKLKLLESVIEAKIPEADQQALAAIVFNYSVVEFLRIFHRVLHEQQTNVMAENNLKSSVHFHDWTCGIGLIFTHHGTHLKMSTVFMIDAPVVAYETKTPVANETAKERNVYHRLAIERNAANLADFFGPPFP